MKKGLLYAAGLLTLLWGIIHLMPTAKVVQNFGPISHDNKLIITMEWITEGLALLFAGALIILVTRIDTKSRLAGAVYVLVVVALISFALLSLFTGFKINFLPFKLCPVIFSLSALLLIVGMRTGPAKP